MVSFGLIAPPNAVAAEALERVFVGEPTQLTLPPDIRDEPGPPATQPQLGRCKAPSEQTLCEQLDGVPPGAPATRSPTFDDERAGDAKSAELGAGLAKSRADSAKTQP
jgi:hypothetical protein